MEAQKENRTVSSLDCLENPDIDLSNLDEKERLSVAMSSYFLLYR